MHYTSVDCILFANLSTINVMYVGDLSSFVSYSLVFVADIKALQNSVQYNYDIQVYYN